MSPRHPTYTTLVLSPMGNFAFNAKRFFLTYSQTGDGLNESDIQSHLCMVGPLGYAIVCREAHADGGTHYHSVAIFERKVQSRNSGLFDVNGFHPNIQPIKHLGKSISYVCKAGIFWELGDRPATGPAEKGLITPSKFDTEGEYLRAAALGKLPFGYAQRLWALRTNQRIPPVFFDDTEWRGTISLSQPQLVFRVPAPTGSTVLIGPSGCGKSTWAIHWAKRPTLVASHMEDLRYLDSMEINSIIFDDMDFNHYPVTTQIHLVDKDLDRTIHSRYKNIHIPANIQKIFTCNSAPLALTHDAIKRRCYIIDLTI